MSAWGLVLLAGPIVLLLWDAVMVAIGREA